MGRVSPKFAGYRGIQALPDSTKYQLSLLTSGSIRSAAVITSMELGLVSS